MANYTWKLATAYGQFLNAANWDQGTVPGPGDTAVIDASSVPASSGAKVETFLDQATLDGVSAIYRYTWDSQGQATLPSAYLTNATLGAGTTLTVTATDSNPSDFGLVLSSGAEIPLFGTNTNNGTIAIGTPGDGTGTKVTSSMFADSTGTGPGYAFQLSGLFTNAGLITVDDNAFYNINSSEGHMVVDNTGMISVSNGSTLVVGNPTIGVGPSTSTQSFVNDGIVSIRGAAGTTTQATINFPLQGTGTLIVDGGSNAVAGQTTLSFDTDVAGVNIELQSHGQAQYNQNLALPAYTGGSVTFEDATGTLYTNPYATGSNSASRPIYGFQAGDVIGLLIGLGGLDQTHASGLSWNQSTHLLSVLAGSKVIYSYNLVGTYAQGDFGFAYNGGTIITTTNTSNQAVTQSVGSTGQTVLSVPTGAPVTTAASGATVVNLGVAYSSVTSQGRDTVNAGAGQASVMASGAATTVAGGAGRLVFQGGAGSAVVSTGSGGGTITTGTASSQVFLGSASDVVNAHGQDFVVASTGSDTVYAASAVVAYGGTAGSLVVESGAVASTVVGGGGAATVYGSGGAGGVVYAGTGATEYVGGPGASTFVGSTGTALVYGGSGGGAIYAGSGGGQYFGASASTVIEVGGASTVTASDGNAVFVVGSGSNLLVAGAGNVTLAGGTSSGSNSYFAGFGADQVSGGAGNDVFIAGTGQATLSGGGGSNLFSFVANGAGGSDVITDFHAGVDHLSLQGYAAGAVQVALSGAARSGGATVLSLGDGTRVTLLGVGALHTGDFV